jgi:hypothetical protein
MVVERFYVGEAVVEIATGQPMIVTHVADSLAGQMAVTARHRALLNEEFVYRVFKPEQLRHFVEDDGIMPMEVGE